MKKKKTKKHLVQDRDQMLHKIQLVITFRYIFYILNLSLNEKLTINQLALIFS